MPMKPENNIEIHFS